MKRIAVLLPLAVCACGEKPEVICAAHYTWQAQQPSLMNGGTTKLSVAEAQYMIDRVGGDRATSQRAQDLARMDKYGAKMSLQRIAYCNNMIPPDVRRKFEANGLGPSGSVKVNQ